MADLRQLSGCEAIVRTMPNTPAMIGQGVTVWCKTDVVTEEQSTLVRRILRAMGEEIFVQVHTQILQAVGAHSGLEVRFMHNRASQDEQFLDMATAISGSGPAYHYMVCA
eukprot:COSAG01_NODE_7304_length_3260_cov_7.615628_3_plen_110_part_00